MGEVPGDIWIVEGRHNFEVIQWWLKTQLQFNRMMQHTKCQLNWTYSYWGTAVWTSLLWMTMPQPLQTSSEHAWICLLVKIQWLQKSWIRASQVNQLWLLKIEVRQLYYFMVKFLIFIEIHILLNSLTTKFWRLGGNPRSSSIMKIITNLNAWG